MLTSPSMTAWQSGDCRSRKEAVNRRYINFLGEKKTTQKKVPSLILSCYFWSWMLQDVPCSTSEYDTAIVLDWKSVYLTTIVITFYHITVVGFDSQLEI